jgi:signal recognition particle subunit SEC65
LERTAQREKHKELNGTVCIYSPYLNKFKTIQEGRRIPRNIAVEEPTAWEILEVR